MRRQNGRGDRARGASSLNSPLGIAGRCEVAARRVPRGEAVPPEPMSPLDLDHDAILHSSIAREAMPAIAKLRHAVRLSHECRWPPCLFPMNLKASHRARRRHDLEGTSWARTPQVSRKHRRRMETLMRCPRGPPPHRPRRLPQLAPLRRQHLGSPFGCGGSISASDAKLSATPPPSVAKITPRLSIELTSTPSTSTRA